MKMTEWFPSDVKPVRIGVYETISPVFKGARWFSYWNGQDWCRTCPQASQVASAFWRCRNQNRRWRGLAEKPE